MGVEWVEKHTSPCSNGPRYFRLDIPDRSEELGGGGGQKIVDLGVLLLKLQCIEGFDFMCPSFA